MNNRKILIVEDEVLFAMEIEKRLKELGYEICGIAGNSQDAIRLSLSADPALILMDIKINDAIDGIETASIINSTKKIPVIYITAFSDQATLSKAIRSNPFGYLNKPIQVNDLMTTIEVAFRIDQIEKELEHTRDLLEKSSRRNTALLNALPDLILTVTADGIITDYNASAAGGTILPEEFGIFKNLSQFFPADIYKSVLQAVQNIISLNKSESFEYSIAITSDIKYFEARTSKVDENHAMILIRNITERKMAEKALIKSEEDYRKIFEEAHDPILIFRPEGEIVLEVNQRACEVYGYSRDEFIGMSLENISKNIPAGKEKIKTVLKDGICNGFETVQHRKDGSEMIIEVNASEIIYKDDRAIISINRDITERKHLENELKQYKEHLEDIVRIRTIELKESEEKFRALSENSEDVIMRYDRNLKHLYANYAAEKLLRIPVKNIIGKYFTDLGFDKELISVLEENLKKVFSSKRKNRIEIKFPNNKWMDWIIIPEYNENNEVDTIITSGRDITNIKKYEEAINKAFNKEKELNELKTRFISTVSHEFRTPLASILSSIQLMQRYGSKWSEEKLNEHVGRINESVNYVTDLMDDVLTVSRAEAGKIKYHPEVIDLKDTLLKFIEEINPQFGKKHKFFFKFTSAEVNFKLDKHLLRSIIVNLIENAIKFSPDGGAIRLEIAHEHPFLTFKVSDEGMGIEEHEIPNIFDPFFRTSASLNIPGTGLGLDIVKRAVDLCEGTIEVSSTIKKGTSFIVKLSV